MANIENRWRIYIIHIGTIWHMEILQYLLRANPSKILRNYLILAAQPK